MTDNTSTTTAAIFQPRPAEQKSQPFAQIQPKRIAVSKAAIAQFDIPASILQERPALVDLILRTESMQDPERKHWFKLLPIMTPEQVQKLQTILQDESAKLAELNRKYSQEVTKLNQRTSNWSPEQIRRVREENKTREKKAETQEKTEEEDLLRELEGI